MKTILNIAKGFASGYVIGAAVVFVLGTIGIFASTHHSNVTLICAYAIILFIVVLKLWFWYYVIRIVWEWLSKPAYKPPAKRRQSQRPVRVPNLAPHRITSHR